MRKIVLTIEVDTDDAWIAEDHRDTAIEILNAAFQLATQQVVITSVVH